MSDQPQATHISPDAGDITLHDKGNVSDVIAANHDGQQTALAGFDPRFRDIVDFIVKITHEIWEERGIGRLYDYYATNMQIHTSDGDLYGRDRVIEGTIQSLAAIPNRRLYADEVIWDGNDGEGYYSSHRITHEGNNWGHTSYGPPTGRRVQYRAIADCAIREGVIYEEWLARDELALVLQLGFDPHQLAQKVAAFDREASPSFAVPAEPERLRGQLPPAAPPADSAHFDIERFVTRALHEVWNWRLLNLVEDYYRPGFLYEGTAGRALYGRNQYRAYILSLLAPFPDLALAIDHFCALQDGPGQFRTATRWTMTGTHTGPGVYGRPTGQTMRIMGMSHHLVSDGHFAQEWTVYDEFALLKQIYRPQ